MSMLAFLSLFYPFSLSFVFKSVCPPNIRTAAFKSTNFFVFFFFNFILVEYLVSTFDSITMAYINKLVIALRRTLDWHFTFRRNRIFFSFILHPLEHNRFDLSMCVCVFHSYDKILFRILWGKHTFTSPFGPSWSLFVVSKLFSLILSLCLSLSHRIVLHTVFFSSSCRQSYTHTAGDGGECLPAQ